MHEIYTGGRTRPEVVKKGEYKNLEYLILTNGIYPCAYINVSYTPYALKPIEHPCLDAFPCHGGVTYSWKKYPYQEDENEGYWFLGWDYAHGEEDYNPVYNSLGHRWTIEEIEEECKRGIDFIHGGNND